MTKVVVIEDNAAVREEILGILRFEGFEVAAAENGRVGLEVVKRVLPDVIVCDLMMPVLDGYGTLEAVRADPATATIPFLCLTARAERPDTRRAMESGADDYIVKPFSAEDLLHGIAAALERRARTRDASEAKLAELKAALSSMLPHELRTPLATILGHAEILGDPEVASSPEEVTLAAKHILAAGLRLNRLAENFLLYSQLGVLGRGGEAVAATPTPIECGEVVEGMARTRASDHGRHDDLVLEVESACVCMPARYVGKLVEELVDNACKFSPRGTRVHVQLRRAGHETQLVIRDQGRGMTPEQVSQVGGYVQFDRHVHEQQGVGLGLSIAGQLARLTGGILDIESIPGQGTTVSVRIPAVATMTEVAPHR